jgi:hypothetical protein
VLRQEVIAEVITARARHARRGRACLGGVQRRGRPFTMFELLTMVAGPEDRKQGYDHPDEMAGPHPSTHPRLQARETGHS